MEGEQVSLVKTRDEHLKHVATDTEHMTHPHTTRKHVEREARRDNTRSHATSKTEQAGMTSLRSACLPGRLLSNFVIDLRFATFVIGSLSFFIAASGPGVCRRSEREVDSLSQVAVAISCPREFSLEGGAGAGACFGFSEFTKRGNGANFESALL